MKKDWKKLMEKKELKLEREIAEGIKKHVKLSVLGKEVSPLGLKTQWISMNKMIKEHRSLIKSIIKILMDYNDEIYRHQCAFMITPPTNDDMETNNTK
jgi:predicted ATP-grasp superfamily ATP-dependent carboligase